MTDTGIVKGRIVELFEEYEPMCRDYEGWVTMNHVLEPIVPNRLG